jgi:hypothetical protein
VKSAQARELQMKGHLAAPTVEIALKWFRRTHLFSLNENCEGAYNCYGKFLTVTGHLLVLILVECQVGFFIKESMNSE